MDVFLGLLEEFKKKNKEFVAAINCGKVTVKINAINGEMVTLHETDTDNRYDLHYTQVVICSKSEGS